jgi:phosphatidylinositol alpha-1,6-mannosyltransferase
MILAATQIYGSHGGIPSYMRRLSEIFSAVTAKQDRPFAAVSLLDETWEPARHVQPVHFNTFHGSSGARGRFLLDLVRTAIKHRNQTLVLGHVALSPIALFLLRMRLIRSYVVVLHGIEAWRRLRSTERLACRSAAAIVATTRFTQRIFAAKNDFAEDRISVVPLGIDRPCFPPLADAKTAACQQLRILFVGRLWSIERYKGADELIDAVALMRSENIQVAVNFVGTGDDVSRLEDKVKLLRLEYAVTFRGAVADEELKAAYAACDLFALPSSGEGFGITFLEAMAHAKPCLGARCGGIPEVIDDGVDGFLVSYGAVDEIVACLKRCNADRRLLREMGGRAYQKVSNHYLLGNMLENWQNLLAEHGCA